MATFEVETDLLISVRVKVTVEADDKDDAIEQAADDLPNNFDPKASKAWKAKVDLKAPKGVRCRVVRAYHFEQAGGSDKARKIAGGDDGRDEHPAWTPGFRIRRLVGGGCRLGRWLH